MPTTALSSDHVNYLIFRYLQEAGHENSATAFHRDWHRQPEYRDPENYPFAGLVRRNELVSLIQTGLFHDELEAKVRKDARRYVFARPEVGRGEKGEGMENGFVARSDAEAEGVSLGRSKGKTRPSASSRSERMGNEFPTPPPKRQRRSGEGTENLHVNGEHAVTATATTTPGAAGDAMDVDAAESASAVAEAENDVASPSVASEVEVIEVPERYDSMDVAVQTEAKTPPKTSTLYWKMEKPGAVMYHCEFHPGDAGGGGGEEDESGNGNVLMVVGEALCRFYQLPENFDAEKQLLSIDEPSLPPKSVITASAWHPQGHCTAFAVDSVRDLPDGRQVSQQSVFEHNSQTGTSLQLFAPPFLEPAGVVLALRYLPHEDLLLVLRTNLKRSLVLVYNAAGKAERGKLIAWRIFEQQVLDVVWTSGDEFFVCGEMGLAASYRIENPSGFADDGEMTAESIAVRNLVERKAEVLPHLREETWDKVRKDSATEFLAIASSREARLTITSSAFVLAKSCTLTLDFPSPITALAFVPREQSSPAPRSTLLAIALENGSCILHHNASASLQTQEDRSEILRLHVSDGPALALAWSPQQAFLAVAGTDLVQIWDLTALVGLLDSNEEADVADFRSLARRDELHKPLLTWRPDAGATGSGVRNGELEEERDRPLSEPSLSWSADGESLAFAVERQIAIIRFRPVLGSSEQETIVNGHASVEE